MASWLTSGVARGATLSAVQSGTTTLTAGSAATTATITSVDLSKSFLVFSVRLNSSDPFSGLISGQITNPTTLTFQRNSAAGSIAVTIEWYVAEFVSGVAVQRGATQLTASSSNQPIANVDVAKSFPIASYRAPGTVFSDEEFVKVRLTSGTNLNFSINGTPAAGSFVEWQIVEFTLASVQSGDLAFGTTDSSQTAAPTSVDPAKSWLFHTYKTDVGTGTDIGQKLVRGVITNPTTLTFDRSNTGQTIDLTWYLVEFTDSTTVQHASESFSTSATQRDVALTSVDTLTSIATAGYMTTGGRSPYNSDDNPGVAWVTADLTSATNLRLTRELTGSSSADIGWSVVDFSTLTHTITGRVFVDAVITGTQGGPFNLGEGDTGISGARVELYDADSAFQSSTTTDGSGNYTFANVGGGAKYTIRVVASTLAAGVGALPDQTFESDGIDDYGDFTAAMGGQNPLAADTTAQSTLAGAEHRVAVFVGAADVTGVDFGFSYELIVNTNDTGQGSFRRFLGNANMMAGVQSSRFNIPTTDPNYTASPLAYTIQPLSPLPEITGPTVVTGTTQPDFVSAPIIDLDGSQAGAGASGLRISGGGSTVRGLVIRQFTLNGIHVTSTGGNTIAGNYIGTDVAGLLDRGNGAHGIHIDSDTGSNTIGGVLVALRNVISGNGADGILLEATSDNAVHGNYIGTDKNGAPSIGNDGHGILINGGSDNSIGGTAVGQGNLISGNANSGVAVTG